MKYDLVRPCPNCPFRADVLPFLRPGRIAEIVDSITKHDQPFACHETIDYEAWHRAGRYVHTTENQQCAGALIMLKRADHLFDNWLFRLAVRDELLDPDRLDNQVEVISYEDALADRVKDNEPSD